MIFYKLKQVELSNIIGGGLGEIVKKPIYGPKNLRPIPIPEPIKPKLEIL